MTTLGINGFGAVAFLMVASRFWVEPELAGISGASGGAAIGWFFMAAPIFLVLVLFNIGVCIWAVIVCRKQGSWPLSNLVWLSIPMWLFALVIDTWHHQ